MSCSAKSAMSLADDRLTDFWYTPLSPERKPAPRSPANGSLEPGPWRGIPVPPELTQLLPPEPMRSATG